MVSSHIFSSLVDICVQILLLKNGKIIQTALTDQFKEMEKAMKVGKIKDKIIKSYVSRIKINSKCLY